MKKKALPAKRVQRKKQGRIRKHGQRGGSEAHGRPKKRKVPLFTEKLSKGRGKKTSHKNIRGGGVPKEKTWGETDEINGTW